MGSEGDPGAIQHDGVPDRGRRSVQGLLPSSPGGRAIPCRHRHALSCPHHSTYQEAGREVLGLQLTQAGTQEAVGPWQGKYILLQGSLFGLLGEENREALCLVIRRKARGHKTAVTLSGGYDSTCLANLSTCLDCGIDGTCGGYAVQTYDTDDNVYNETEYARRIAHRLGIPFRRYLFDCGDVLDVMTTVPRIIDQPRHEPTSFLLFSRRAADDGYTAVISEIGGGACSAPKQHCRRVSRSLPVFKAAARIPPGRRILGPAARAARGREAFAAGRAFLHGQPPGSALELLPCLRSPATVRAVGRLLGPGMIDEMNQLDRQRARVMDRILAEAASTHEWHILFALWVNPGEYHVDCAVTYSGALTIMPFVEPVTTGVLLSHAARHELENRKFEMQVFGGIPRELLPGSQSGFCLPYGRWCAELLLDDLEEIGKDKAWQRFGVDLPALSEFGQRAQRVRRAERGALDREAAAMLWRLVMLKRYAEARLRGEPYSDDRSRADLLVLRAAIRPGGTRAVRDGDLCGAGPGPTGGLHANHPAVCPQLTPLDLRTHLYRIWHLRDRTCMACRRVSRPGAIVDP